MLLGQVPQTFLKRVFALILNWLLEALIFQNFFGVRKQSINFPSNHPGALSPKIRKLLFTLINHESNSFRPDLILFSLCLESANFSASFLKRSTSSSSILDEPEIVIFDLYQYP